MEKQLLDACEKGNHEEVQQLIYNNRQININCKNEYGFTPFFIACGNGYTQIVRLLNLWGAERNHTNDGVTPYGLLVEKEILKS